MNGLLALSNIYFRLSEAGEAGDRLKAAGLARKVRSIGGKQLKDTDPGVQTAASEILRRLDEKEKKNREALQSAREKDARDQEESRKEEASKKKAAAAQKRAAEDFEISLTTKRAQKLEGLLQRFRQLEGEIEGARESEATNEAMVQALQEKLDPLLREAQELEESVTQEDLVPQGEIKRSLTLLEALARKKVPQEMRELSERVSKLKEDHQDQQIQAAREKAAAEKKSYTLNKIAKAKDPEEIRPSLENPDRDVQQAARDMIRWLGKKEKVKAAKQAGAADELAGKLEQVLAQFKDLRERMNTAKKSDDVNKMRSVAEALGPALDDAHQLSNAVTDEGLDREGKIQKLLTRLTRSQDSIQDMRADLLKKAAQIEEAGEEEKKAKKAEKPEPESDGLEFRRHVNEFKEHSRDFLRARGEKKEWNLELLSRMEAALGNARQALKGVKWSEKVSAFIEVKRLAGELKWQKEAYKASQEAPQEYAKHREAAEKYFRQENYGRALRENRAAGEVIEKYSRFGIFEAEAMNKMKNEINDLKGQVRAAQVAKSQPVKTPEPTETPAERTTDIEQQETLVTKTDPQPQITMPAPISLREQIANRQKEMESADPEGRTKGIGQIYEMSRKMPEPEKRDGAAGPH